MNSSISHIRSRPIRIGTRGSKLARWQAEWVAEQVAQSGQAVELVEVATRGDQQQSGALTSIGGEGVFTKELQRALLDEEVDLAVHSLKDLPTTPVTGLILAAVPVRASPEDVLVSSRAESLDALPTGARVGTGSLRREAQLRAARPDLQVEGIRGNVDTRLRKLDEGRYDALVLAAAGLKRLGLVNRIAAVLPPEVMLPAVGQGALGIECRTDDAGTRSVLNVLNHGPSMHAVVAERQLLACLDAGCSAPVGALAELDEQGQLSLSAVVLSADGGQRLACQQHGPASDAKAIGQQAASELISRGADALIAAARR